MTAAAIPPAGQNPASPGQRQAARDHVTQLRQHGWTYRSIAAAAALSPDTVRALATGRRTAQPATATAVLKLTSRILSRSRLDAGGTRLRLRALHVMGHGSARIARAAGVHPHRPSASSSAATPAPSAPSCAPPSSPSTRPGGTSAPPNAPAPNAPRPPPPANAPSPGTGAPPPPWTTTCSTSPATGPGAAGNPPPAPAPPPTSARPPPQQRRGA